MSLQDPLAVNIPMRGIDTTLPLFPERDYELQCSKSVIEPNKDQNGLNWNLEFNTLAPIQAVDGREISAGFTFYLTVALQPAADAKDPQGFLRGIGQAIDALTGSNKDNRPDLTHSLASSVVGRKVIGSIFHDTWKGTTRSKLSKIAPVPAGL